MAQRLILWDVDGTLVSCGSVGRDALETGAGRAARLPSVPRVTMSGKTDPQIVGEILTEAGLTGAEIGALMPAALEEAARALAASERRLTREGRVHPGVREGLTALSAVRGAHQTLVTGNIVENAKVKVGAFRLGTFFDFAVGAYGSDHADRTCLVPICLDRVRDVHGKKYEPDEIWVIGDTANDLRCARAAGVRCLLVGTGHPGFEAVRGLGADAELPDLADTEAVLELLLD